jgi:hypothetical protein
MRRKKAVTEAVLAANRANAQSSTGPRTEPGKSNACLNALKHGILATRVVFKTDKEKTNFQEVFRRCYEHWRPQGAEEKFQTEEIAILRWKLGLTEVMETSELLRRQELSGKVDGVFHKSLHLPINDVDLPLASGWDCERLVVRAVAGENEVGSNASRRPVVIQNQIQPSWHAVKSQANKTGRLEVEAVLASSLANITRYRSGLKRDLYKAIDMLRAAQKERREREQLLRQQNK